MYTTTQYDIDGNQIGRVEHSEVVSAPALIEYPDVVAQLNAEEWDMRDATNPLESLRDREDWLYA